MIPSHRRKTSLEEYHLKRCYLTSNYSTSVAIRYLWLMRSTALLPRCVIESVINGGLYINSDKDGEASLRLKE